MSPEKNEDIPVSVTKSVSDSASNVNLTLIGDWIQDFEYYCQESLKL